MLRFAIYARHSSDRQNPKSCADQIAECEARVGAMGGVVVKRYADEAVSGAHEAQRPQYLAMLTGMKLGTFDAVMAEDLDRLNRNLEASARLYSLAERDGVELWTLADGRITQLHTGLKGLMGEMFLKQLGDKTRRGMMAVARDGRIAGGNCYGYAASAGEKRGLREIVDTEAAVIRRIFHDYACGVSPVAICTSLNRENVKPPRGKEWRVSTLIGSAKRLNGILANPIYSGRPVFNRQRFIKDPETGKRIAKPNPPETWLYQDVPALRIVPTEVWEAVQARRMAAAGKGGAYTLRRPKTLLSGLVRCEECGTPMALCNGYFRCTAHGTAGTCGNNRGVRADRLEGMVLDGLRAAMDDEELVSEYTRHLRATLARLTAETEKQAEAVTRKRAEIDRKIGNILAAIEDGQASVALSARLAALEAEREALQIPKPAPAVPLLSDAPARYRRGLAEIELLLKGEGAESVRARELVRSLVSRIGARRQGSDVWIEVDAKFGALLALARGPDAYAKSGCGSPQQAMAYEVALPIVRQIA